MNDSDSIKIANAFGEGLDVLIEGNRSAKQVIVFVHGFGTDKDEGFSSFIDLSNAFKYDYLIVRYDTSGYGKSEGEDKAYNLHKASGDLQSVLRWVYRTYPDKKVNVIAHSLGSFSALLLSPPGVSKFIFTSIPNADTKIALSKLQERIKSKGSQVNEHGITVYRRSRGGEQLIGPEFWLTLRNLAPARLLEELGKVSQVAVFKPEQDDVLSPEGFEEYEGIPRIRYAVIKGNHNFTDLEDRKSLINEIRAFLAKS